MSEYTRPQVKIGTPECNLLIDLVKKAAKMWIDKKARTRIDAARIAIDLADYGTEFTNAGIVDGYIKRLEEIHNNNGKVKFSSKYTCVNAVIEGVYESVYGKPLIIEKEGLDVVTDSQHDEQIPGQMSVADIKEEITVPDVCDQERVAMEIEEELPFCDDPEPEYFPEPFDVWQSDIYSFLTGWCRFFSLEDGVYTLRIDKDLLERRFKKEA